MYHRLIDTDTQAPDQFRVAGIAVRSSQDNQVPGIRARWSRHVWTGQIVTSIGVDDTETQATDNADPGGDNPSRSYIRRLAKAEPDTARGARAQQ